MFLTRGDWQELFNVRYRRDEALGVRTLAQFFSPLWPFLGTGTGAVGRWPVVPIHRCSPSREELSMSYWISFGATFCRLSCRKCQKMHNGMRWRVSKGLSAILGGRLNVEIPVGSLFLSTRWMFEFENIWSHDLIIPVSIISIHVTGEKYSHR